MMNVVENVDEEVFEVIDRGAPRSTADALARDKNTDVVRAEMVSVVLNRIGADGMKKLLA